MKWRESTLFAVDTETTGVDFDKDRVVELGACRAERMPPRPHRMDAQDGPECQCGQPSRHQSGWCGQCLVGWKLSRLGNLLNPGIAIPAEATEINGITNEMVANKPRIADIAERFLARVAAADVLVGYNWPFDERMLRQELGEPWELAIDGKPVLDPLVLVRTPQVGKFWPGAKKGNPGRHRLENVAARSDIGIRRRGRAHRASSDAELTIRLLLHFGDSSTKYGGKLARHLPDDAYEMSALIARWREEQERDFQAYLATQPEQHATA